MEIQLSQTQRFRAMPQAVVAEPQEFDIADLRQRLLKQLGASCEAYPEHIERQFPHILAKLVELWGRPRMDAYLQSLMISDRPHRQGFPSKVAAEIFRLSVLHGSLGVNKEPVPIGWASVSDSEIVKYFRKSAA